MVSLPERRRCVTYLKTEYASSEGQSISRERVRLIRRREGLQVVRKRRKRKLLGMTTQWVNQAHYPNHVWSYDFFDRTEDAM